MSIKIEKLKRNNFDTWKIQAQALLIKNDVWEFVSGKKKRPEKTEGNQKIIDDWDYADQKAKADLILSISPSELNQIKDCVTSNDIWRRLHEIYVSRGPARKATLLKKILYTKMKDNEDVKDFLRNFMETVDKLSQMNLQINEDILVIVLLHSLPETMENFRCAIETRDDLPKLETLRIKIIEEFESRLERDNSIELNSSGAMTARNFSKYRSSNFERKERKFPFTCHNCGKVGHMRSDCKLQSKSKYNKKQSMYLSDEREYIGYGNLESSFNNSWCLDSGSTSHMCAHINKFEGKMKNASDIVNLANNSCTDIKGRGNVNLTVHVGKNTEELILKDTLYVPDLRTNLMSVPKITENGYTVEFNRYRAAIKDKNGVVTTVAKRIKNLYVVTEKQEIANVSKEFSKLEMWHQRFGHLHERALTYMLKNNSVAGLNFEKQSKLQPCEICLRGKMTQQSFPKKSSRISQNLLDIVHSDICGPMRTQSIGGNKYFITFTDDKSRWCEVRFMREKSEALKYFKEYKEYAEKQTGKKIKCIQTDNGKEYCNNNFKHFLKGNGIHQRLTVPYTPQQGGIAERKNRTLVEMARCLLIQSNLPPKFWAEAILTSNYIRNRCASASISMDTPFHLWHGKIPSIHYFRIFGSQAYALNKKPGKNKFEERGEKCIFIGYSEESKAYRLWCPRRKFVFVSRDVKFLNKFQENEEYQEIYKDESKQINDCQSGSETESEDIDNYEVNYDSKGHHSKQRSRINENVKEKSFEENQPNIQEQDAITENEESSEYEVSNENYQDTEAEESFCDEDEVQVEPIVKNIRGRPRIIRTGKVGRPRKEYRTEEVQNIEEEANSVEVNVKEALNGEDKTEWLQAVCEEFISLIKNNTWKITKLPHGRKEVGCRLVLTNKCNFDGSLQKRKARLVAKGYSQVEGVDFNKTFSPVVSMKSIRILMAVASQLNLKVHQFDIKSAYLNGEIEEEIFMKIPEHLKEVLEEIIKKKNVEKNVRDVALDWLRKISNKGEKMTCLLTKSLYGLRQSGRQWNKKLNEVLLSMNLTRLKTDPCIYFKKDKNEIIIVATFVDDIIVASNSIRKIHKFKEILENAFEVKDMGKIKQCLGIEFSQSEKGEVTMSQNHYILELLERFGMENSKSVKTPLEVNLKLKKTEINCESTNNYPYQNLIGCLQYLSNGTRPDITYAVNYLSQFNTCYGKDHWQAAKRILRYLKGTLNYKISYIQNNENLVGFSDADWASCIIDRRSYTGYTFMFAGAAISWAARKQSTVALSSTEAEYMALVEAAKEAMYLQNLFNELSVETNKMKIFCDNVGAGLLAENNVFHTRTKHIDVRHHFIRDVIDSGKIEIKYIPTEDMTADIMTKGLTFQKHLSCVEKLHLTNLNLTD